MNYLDWSKKYKEAQNHMQQASNNEGILIEVAAQHPLVDGKYPNEEFKKRLDLGIKFYEENIHRTSVKIYIPGSRHQINGKADEISLTKAGKNYLLSKGIPEEDIFSEESNEKYRGEYGVYCSMDECYVASRLFKDNNMRELYSICSPAQMMRKVLCYIYFGYIPHMYTAPCDEMFHNYIDEIFKVIPHLLEDSEYFNVDSEENTVRRKDRNPDLNK